MYCILIRNKFRFLEDYLLANGPLNFWECFYILLIVCCREIEICNFFFLLSLTSCDFWSPFCPFPTFLLSLNLFPQLHTFCTCKVLSGESPFALLPPPHSAPNLHTNVQPHVTRLQCAVIWLSHMAKALGRTSTSTSVSSHHVQSSRKSLYKEMEMETPFLPAACRAGSGELQRNPSKTCRPEYSSSGHILMLLCGFIFKRKIKGNKQTKNLHRTPTPKPLSPSA